jgi:putative transposase
MPIKRPQFVNGEIYHIIIRGAGDALVFKDKKDYYRGIFSLYEFNNTNSVLIRDRRRARAHAKKNNKREPSSATYEKWVEIFAFCFMPNHIHLLLKQIKNQGISEFIRKFGAGYVGYFNKRYNRKGPLFIKFRAVRIKTDEQLQIVFTYIHTNPISLIEPNWKEEGIKDKEKVIEFLENYKWSSYRDYLSKKNFPSLTQRDFLLKVMGQSQGSKDFIESWINHKKQFYFNELFLE